jgi:hypothetical protein
MSSSHATCGRAGLITSMSRTRRSLLGLLGALPVWLLAALLVLLATTGVRADIEGFGTSTTGGAGGEVYFVTNLNDSGPGSLRDAVSTGNRMVVFSVAGTIHLTSPIFVKGAHVTIDGLTAPPPGITLVGNGLIIRGNVGAVNPTPAHDVIVRGLRIRSVPDPFDTLQVSYGAYNVVISHVSVWDSGDGLIDITEHAHDVTVAWSILAGGVKAMLIKYGVERVTLHNNIFVSGRNRNPQVSMDDVGTPATDTTVDMRNNLVYDWAGGSGTTIHHGARANLVANFYSSPASLVSDQEQALIVCQGGVCFDGNPLNTARAFAQDNVSGDFLAIDINDVGTENAPFPAPPVTIDDACTAARLTLEGAGARPLDTIDVQYLAGITFPICRRTTTTLTATDSPTPLGAPITFTATVQARPPAVGTPEGAVTFFTGVTAIGTVPLAGSVATLITTTFPQGTTTVKAVYSGEADFSGEAYFDPSYISLKHRVIGAPTSTTLTALANPSHLGVPVTLTATVTALPPSTATAEGTVRFFDGTRVLGYKPLVGGVATLVTSTLPAGFRTMKAQFLGDSRFAASSSTALSLRIDGGTVTSLTRLPSSADTGQLVTFTARVSSMTGGGTPTGTVTFRDGTAILGTLELNSAGTAVLATNTLAVAKHVVTASYNGSSSFERSVSLPVSTSVVKGSTKTTLSSTSLPLLLGHLVTFTAVVTPLAPATGTPVGPLKFKDGGITLATVNLSGGMAQFSTTALILGTHSIFGAYASSAQFQASNSNKITVQVNNP